MLKIYKILLFLPAIALLVFGATLEGIIPREIGSGIDSILSGESVHSVFHTISITILLSFICGRLGVFWVRAMTISAIARLRSYLYSFWSDKYYETFKNIEKGEFSQMINDDVQHIEEFTIESFIDILVTFISFMIAAINIYLVSPTIFISLLVLYSTYFLPFRNLLKQQRKLQLEQRENKQTIKVFTQEYLSNKEKVYFLFSGDYIRNRLHSLSDRINDLTVKIELSVNKTKLLPRTIDSLGPGFIIIFGGLKVISNELSIGELVTILTSLHYVSSPFKYSMTFISSIQEVIISSSKLVEWIRRFKESKEKHIALASLPIMDAISTPRHGYFLVKGKNGAGKSTLFKEVYFHEAGLKQEDKMFVPQEFVLIRGTVEENLMRDDLTPFSSLLEVLPALHTYIEDDTHLSTGQKAVMNLIRQTNFNAQLVLLDELGSNIDESVRIRIEAFLLTYFSEVCIVEITHLENGILLSKDVTNSIEV